MSDSPQDLESILDEILDSNQDQDAVSVGDLLNTFGSRSFGPLIVAPAALMLTPIGAIPGAPAVINAFVVLICVQHLAAASHPWLPKWLRDRSVNRDKLESGIDRARPWAKRIDRWLKPRLSFLTKPPVDRVLALIATLLALSIFALGFIPFAAAVPSAGILLIGLSITTRDGLMALLSLGFAAATAWLGVWMAG